MLLTLLALAAIGGFAALFIIESRRKRTRRRSLREASETRIAEARAWEEAHRGKRPRPLANIKDREER